MKTKKTLWMAAIITGFGLAMAAGPVLAQVTDDQEVELQNLQITGTVQNSLTITGNPDTINFGEWAVQQHQGAGDPPFVTMNTGGTLSTNATAGTGGDVNGRFILTDGTDRERAQIQIADGFPGGSVDFVVDTNPVVLACVDPSCAGSGVFNLELRFGCGGAGGCVVNDDGDGSGGDTTLDGTNGTSTIFVGGVLSTEADEVYRSGEYAGDTTITFSYQ